MGEGVGVGGGVVVAVGRGVKVGVGGIGVGAICVGVAVAAATTVGSIDATGVSAGESRKQPVAGISITTKENHKTRAFLDAINTPSPFINSVLLLGRQPSTKYKSEASAHSNPESHVVRNCPDYSANDHSNCDTDAN